MLVRAFGATLSGVDGVLVTVEVDAGSGLPAFQIVGQGDRVVSESRDRIRGAFRQAGLEFPKGRVTVNLVPTHLPKTGSALDLPIAIAIAATSVRLPAESLARTLLVGELGLDGRLHPVRGALALVAAATRDFGAAVVPLDNLPEAAMCPGLTARGAPDLASVLDFLRGACELDSEGIAGAAPRSAPPPDLADLRGQARAQRALEIAAAGGHNLLLVGPPGGGKTLLARRLPGLLPPLPFSWALEATRIHSVAGTLDGHSLIDSPPFRAPHHTISDAGMIGGGRPLRPGEVSLAHRGVLFLDELPEFRRPVLEALRQPLEEGRVELTRAHGSARVAARFQLVAAMNPCPCGYRGDPLRECGCDEGVLRRYRSRLSGPLIDRIDLHVSVPRVPWQELEADTPGERSAQVRARVEGARAVQAVRDAPGDAPRLNCDAPLGAPQLRVSPEGRALLGRAVQKLALSARAFVRALRVSRTIADLEPGADPDSRLEAAHVAEALSFRAP